MRLGRIDSHTTANIGLISGGSAANVVPERCRIVGEARSLEAARAEQLASELVECLTDAANDPECECDLDVTLEREFEGYRVRPSSVEVELAFDALRDCGHEPVATTSGGGSDANALRARGLAVLNLANGTERNHEPGERVSGRDQSPRQHQHESAQGNGAAGPVEPRRRGSREPVARLRGGGHGHGERDDGRGHECDGDRVVEGRGHDVPAAEVVADAQHGRRGRGDPRADGHEHAERPGPPGERREDDDEHHGRRIQRAAALAQQRDLGEQHRRVRTAEPASRPRSPQCSRRLRASRSAGQQAISHSAALALAYPLG